MLSEARIANFMTHYLLCNRFCWANEILNILNFINNNQNKGVYLLISEMPLYVIAM